MITINIDAITAGLGKRWLTYDESVAATLNVVLYVYIPHLTTVKNSRTRRKHEKMNTSFIIFYSVKNKPF